MARNRVAPPIAADPATADLANSLDSFQTPASYGPLTGAIVSVPVGAFQPVSPRAVGQNVVIPAADGATIGRSITLFLENALGTLRIRPVSGTINGVASVTYLAGTTGAIQITSDGAGRWATSLGAPLGWDDVLANDPNTNGHNPIVSVGDFLQLGLAGPTSGSPQIRSGDAELRIRATNLASFGAGTGLTLFSSTGTTEVGADLGSLVLSTHGLARVIVSSNGEWTTPAGSAGQFLRHQGAGTTPLWATVALSDLGTIAANSVVMNATGFVAVPTAVAYAVQSVMLRAAANPVNTTCGADECLQRVGSADLGFSATPRLLRAPQVKTSGTSMTHPTGTRLIVVEGVGGGGASGGVNATAGSIGGAGGSGTWGRKTYTAVGTSSTFTIGTAGTGVSGANGNAGGNSTFTHNAVVLTLPGGNGGVFAAGGVTVGATAGGGTAAGATGADISIQGQGGGDSVRTAAATTPCLAGAGGSNPMGFGGAEKWTGTTQLAALPATGFGSGGPGRANGTSLGPAAAGNNGQPGAFIVWEFS